MHILYVDDSGNVGDARERFFVLGGIALFERGLYHAIKAADDCVEGFDLGPGQDIELHGSPMYAGRDGVWRTIRSRPQREELIHRALGLISRMSAKLFAVAVDKLAAAPSDPVEVAFEEMCNRFNLFLRRTLNRRGEDQRGLIVMDQRTDQQPLQTLARSFRNVGGRWGHFRHLAEVPFFVDSRASRLVQMADLVSWATWRKYEHSDGRFFDPLIPQFDADGGIIHGLVHRRGPAPCYCVACFSRTQGTVVGPGSPSN